MVRRRSHGRRRHKPDPSAGSDPVQRDRAKAPSLSPGRRWVFRAAAMGVPLVLLLVGELVLRLGGVGFDPHFFVRDRSGGDKVWVENPAFGRRFFPRRLARAPLAIRLNVPKPPNTVRIFVLGESAALGDPRPRYGAARYLQVLFEERFPGVRFEVINTSMTAINSHVIREIANDLVGRAGDIWIVYMGNNEMVGPYGAATVFGPRAPPLWMVRAAVTLQRLRLVQALKALWEERAGRGGSPAAWEGMAMFLHNTVPPGDPRRERVRRSFEANLEAILRAARRSGAAVVLSTVAVNLADCPPFHSMDSGLTNEPARERLAEQLRLGAAALGEGRIEEALARFREAIALAPRHAGAHYRLARALQAAGRAGEAREHYQQACEWDALPFRADHRLNEVIRTLAGRFPEGVVLCDAATALGEAAPGGVPGRGSFYEHVHLNFDGNYRLARLWAERVADLLPEPVRSRARSEWADQETCEVVLGLTDWNRRSVVSEMIQRLEQPPFDRQWEHDQHVAYFRHWLATLEERIRHTPPEHARSVYESALQRRPEDPALHENYAEFLEATGDRAAALEHRRRVCALLPHHYFGYYCVGTLLKEMRQVDDALAALQMAARLRPDLADVQTELGSVLAARGDWEAARRVLTRARDLDPTHPQARLFLGAVLAQLGRLDEATSELQAAVRLNPKSAQAHMRLGELWLRSGRWAEGVRQLEEAIRLDPGLDRARLQLAAAWLARGDLDRAQTEVEAVLAREPTSPAALRLKSELERARHGSR